MLRRVWGQGPEINPRGPWPHRRVRRIFNFRLEYACARPEYAGGVGKPGQKKTCWHSLSSACRILFWQSFVQTYLVHAYSCSFAVFSPSLAGSIIIPACRAKRRRAPGATLVQHAVENNEAASNRLRRHASHILEDAVFLEGCRPVPLCLHKAGGPCVLFLTRLKPWPSRV